MRDMVKGRVLVPRLAMAVAVLVISFGGLAAGPGRAEEWLGHIETSADGLHIINPETPLHPAVSVVPEVVWSLDGTDGDVAFGNIRDIAVDPDGNVYLLDSQLVQAMVVDRTGTVVNMVGREGSGPGEFTRVSSVFTCPDGRAGITQNAPGKISIFDESGIPLFNCTLPPFGREFLVVVRSAKFSTGRVYAELLDRPAPENGYRKAYNALVAFDFDGENHVEFDEKVFSRTLKNWHYRECDRERDSNPWVWDVDADGRVFANRDFDSYRIAVYDPNGTIIRFIEREGKSSRRTDEDLEAFQEAMNKLYEGRIFNGVQLTYEVSPTDPAIAEIFARNDGSLWVLPSSGIQDPNTGVYVAFDVFDADGRFDHVANISCPGNYNADRMFIEGDFLIVVRNVRTAIGHEDLDPEEARYEVVCYRLPVGGSGP